VRTDLCVCRLLHYFHFLYFDLMAFVRHSLKVLLTYLLSYMVDSVPNLFSVLHPVFLPPSQSVSQSVKPFVGISCSKRETKTYSFYFLPISTLYSMAIMSVHGNSLHSAGGFKVGWFGLRVGFRLTLFYVYQMNRVNSRRQRLSPWTSQTELIK